MAKGTIKKLAEKGFGFIKTDATEKDLFFHATALAGDLTFDQLAEGMAVEFGIGEGQKGPRAENVKLV